MFLQQPLIIGNEYYICDLPIKSEFIIPQKYILESIVFDDLMAKHKTQIYAKTYVFNNSRVVHTFIHDSPLGWEYNTDILLDNTERNIIKSLRRFYELKKDDKKNKVDLTELSIFLSTMYETKPESFV